MIGRAWRCPRAEVYREGVRAGRWLLMRRSIAEPEEIAYYLCYGPARTNAHELIRIAGRRWVIEDCFEAAKGEVGLDEYEVRKWDGWHRHVTLCLVGPRLPGGGALGSRSMRKTPLKRGSRLGSLSRVDPAYRAGGKAPDPSDDGSRRRRGSSG